MENFLEHLKTLSSAEDFLNYFGIPFDQKAVDVCRLHILQRFYQYIRQEPALAQDAAAASEPALLFVAYRKLLLRAYGDFLTSTPAQEKVFKVFQDAEGCQHVSLESLRASLSARNRDASSPA